MRVVDPDGGEVPADGTAVGEIQVRGPWITDGYHGHDDPDCMATDDAGRRWLRTGDLATVDGERVVRITGRIKDVIKSGGEWISSVELENVLAEAGDRLFDAIVDSPSGVVFTHDDWDVTWQRIRTADGLVHVDIPELLDELAELGTETPPGDDAEWPLLLSAGERRSFTANTIFRDPAWRKKDTDGALRVSSADAEKLGIADGSTARLTTRRSAAVVTVAVDDAMQAGHVALPNGLGLDHVEGRARRQTGVAPNELTASDDRDRWAGTPWHKSVPARLEPV